MIGVAASGATPFTVAALRRAAELGAVTIGVANNPQSPLLQVCGYPVLVETGSELIAGSTRMKAGTAQKVVLKGILGREAAGRLSPMGTLIQTCNSPS